MPQFPVVKLTELEQLLPSISRQYYRLVLVVGPAGSGKTPLLKELCRQHNITYVNLNLALSERLLDLTSKERPLRVGRLLADLLDERPDEIIALDNIELLFDPDLHLDPLALLQGISRNTTLIVAWGGAATENTLTYAVPGHPEYRRYERPDAILIILP